MHESVARAMRGKCVRQRANGENRRFCRSPQFLPYHACEHITRKSRADSCTHCLHARYKCRAGVNLVCTLTVSGHFASLLLREKVTRLTATDEVLLQYIAKENLISLCSHTDLHHYFDHPVSATPTEFASQIGQFPRGLP